MTDAQPTMTLEEDDYPEIRDAVRKICEGFPGEYWRNLEDQPVEGNYPTEFVKALTDSGYLGALIPEEYGGSGLPIRAGAVILETIHESGAMATTRRKRNTCRKSPAANCACRRSA